jgi:hypothetical protein
MVSFPSVFRPPSSAFSSIYLKLFLFLFDETGIGSPIPEFIQRTRIPSLFHPLLSYVLLLGTES